MRPVWFRLRAEWRTRWKAAIALGLIAGLAGAVTIAAMAGARRTATAFDRFRDATVSEDVLVNPDRGAESRLRSRDIGRMPEVAQAARVNGYPVFNPWARTVEAAFDSATVMASDGRAVYDVGKSKLLEGRLPGRSAPNEILVNRAFVHRYHLGVGDTWRAAVVRSNAPPDLQPSIQLLHDIRAGHYDQWITKLRLHITGVGVNQGNLVVDEGFDTAEVLLGPAFANRYNAPLQYWGEVVRLHSGADLRAFERKVEALVPDEPIAFQTAVSLRSKVDRAVRPQSGALGVFALVVGGTGLLVVGQALARQTFLDSVDHATLRSLGATRSQLFTLALLRTVPAAVLAGAVALVGAYLLSPLTPIGVARVAEPHPGLAFDARILVFGALGLIAVVLLLEVVPALRSSRRRLEAPRPSRGSRVARVLASVGARPAAAAGVRMAFEPGKGPTSVPVRTTIASALIAIAAVTGAVVVAASLGHLVDTPSLYGWNWDASVEINGTDPAASTANARAIERVLARDRTVAHWSTTTLSAVEIDGRPITTAGLDSRRPRPGFAIPAGRAPRTSREIALGARTQQTLGVGIGDRVLAKDLKGHRVSLTVTGRVVLPALGTYPGSDKTSPGEGALVTEAALAELGPDFGREKILLDFSPKASDAARAATVARIRKGSLVDEVQIRYAQQPSDVIAYRDVRSTPVVLSLVLALLATMTLAHGLISSVRRRRRELALLKTLGFTRRQVSATVAWHASTVIVIAILIGIPLGIVGGRWAWTTLADDLGAVATPVAPWFILGLGVPVLFCIANAVAFVPGRLAARLPPAAALRSE